jgi:hypothetical protein
MHQYLLAKNQYPLHHLVPVDLVVLVVLEDLEVPVVLGVQCHLVLVVLVVLVVLFLVVLVVLVVLEDQEAKRKKLCL